MQRLEPTTRHGYELSGPRDTAEEEDAAGLNIVDEEEEGVVGAEHGRRWFGCRKCDWNRYDGGCGGGFATFFVDVDLRFMDNPIDLEFSCLAFDHFLLY